MKIERLFATIASLYQTDSSKHSLKEYDDHGIISDDAVVFDHQGEHDSDHTPGKSYEKKPKDKRRTDFLAPNEDSQEHTEIDIRA